eukprot:scaffold295555_cov28-Tisochrysis_lutea.AAC.12
MAPMAVSRHCDGRLSGGRGGAAVVRAYSRESGGGEVAPRHECNAEVEGKQAKLSVILRSGTGSTRGIGSHGFPNELLAEYDWKEALRNSKQRICARVSRQDPCCNRSARLVLSALSIRDQYRRGKLQRFPQDRVPRSMTQPRCGGGQALPCKQWSEGSHERRKAPNRHARRKTTTDPLSHQSTKGRHVRGSVARASRRTVSCHAFRRDPGDTFPSSCTTITGNSSVFSQGCHQCGRAFR